MAGREQHAKRVTRQALVDSETRPDETPNEPPAEQASKNVLLANHYKVRLWCNRGVAWIGPVGGWVIPGFPYVRGRAGVRKVPYSGREAVI